jgi:L-ornithine N5-oxygenase
MENAFIYDLATTRNPRSAFTYVNYLLAQNRLVEFANSDRLNPLREEFEDYLRWCAQQFQDQVRYQSEVVGVLPEKSSNTVRGWNVAVKDKSGNTYMVRTKNIVAPSPKDRNAAKSRPLLGVNFEAGQRIISANDYVSRRNELRGFREQRLDIAVIGSGQQTIEILDDLLACHRLGNITVVTENEALSPLRSLAEEPAPPQPRLCSIWAKPACESKGTVLGSSELIRGECALRVVFGSDATGPASHAGIIIAENTSGQLAGQGLFHGLDALVLGCRQKGTSLEEVQFKRGAVADGCQMWLQSANSEGGRSLARDIAGCAGEVVKAVAGGAKRASGQEEAMLINARM